MLGLTIASPAFGSMVRIPKKYTCQGADINPELNIKGIHSGTKSLAIIMDDPDAPMGTWVHWVVWNIKPTEKIFEDSIPGTEGMNSAGGQYYHGPCPPTGTHRYFFKVYALDTTLNLPQVVGKKELENAMQGHIIAQGELVGVYSKE